MESSSPTQAAPRPFPGAPQAARDSAAAAQRWSPRLWAILIVLCGALFLDALDVSMVGVALPSIRTALGLSTSSLQWVVSGYVLGYGGLLLLGGRAADLLGRRRVPWTEVAGVRVGERADLWLVTTSGTEVRLPAVRARDLPAIGQASGGRIPVPVPGAGQ